jgi:hypothetical protein
VARFIDDFGDNPARKGEIFEIRSGLPRNPVAGWNVETVREAVKRASIRAREPGMPDFAYECFALLAALIDYLDSFHGTGGFQQVLTPDERERVGKEISRILSHSPA